MFRCDETGIEVVANGNICSEIQRMLKTELLTEKTRADADGSLPFETPVWVGFGTLERQTDGKVFFKPVEW